MKRAASLQTALFMSKECFLGHEAYAEEIGMADHCMPAGST